VVGRQCLGNVRLITTGERVEWDVAELFDAVWTRRVDG
jgi:hypothetical protein